MQEQSAAEGYQALTEIGVVRAGQVCGMAVQKGTDRDEDQRQPEDERYAFKLHPHAAGNAPRRGCSENDEIKAAALAVLQAECLKEADRTGCLLGKHDAEYEEDQREAQDFRLEQPMQVHQRLLAVEFDCGSAGKNSD